jgi:eukaryotic-like serine/threonine-protein kinase
VGRVILRARDTMSDAPSPGSRHSPTDILGRMAGEYRLGRKLGEGGFGAVYEAEHPLLKRKAAVKVLHQVAGRDSDAVLRFISEAQAVNQIRCRHIIDIFSFGTLPDGRHFYVMDLLDGEPLDRYLDRQTRLTVPETLQLLRPIAEALDAAHAAGIVHRDLKPQNIFLTWSTNGETAPKLLDFGMAKLLGESPVHTASGTPMGTPLYMSPEQARGDKVDGRSDVYAMGVLCHELLTGQLPITGESTLVVLVAHLMQSPSRASEACSEVAPALDEPLLRMLEKDPNARPKSAGAALDALVRAAESTGHVIPPGLPHLPAPPPRAEAKPGETEEFSPSAKTLLAASEQDTRATEPDVERQALVRSANSSPRRRGASFPFLVTILALGGGATYLASSAMKPAVPPATPSANVRVQPAASLPSPVEAPSAVTADQAQTPVKPRESVELTVLGAPRGARVWFEGKSLGETSQPVSLPFAETAVELSVTAPGYESASLTVTPNKAQDATVKLVKKRVSNAAPREVRGAIPKDLESPF